MSKTVRETDRPLPHEAVAAHHRDLDALAARFGFTNPCVFGSAATRTDRPGSDLDLVVTRTDGTGLLTVSAFAEAASDLLGVDVDMVTDGGLRPDHEILATAVPL